MSEQKTTQQPEQELSEQRRVRREKLAALQEEGFRVALDLPQARIPSSRPGSTGTPPLHRSRSTLTRWRAGP